MRDTLVALPYVYQNEYMITITTMKRWEREYDDNDDNKDIWEGQFVWVGVITVPTSSIKP